MTQPCTIYLRLPRLRMALPPHHGRLGRRVKIIELGDVTRAQFDAICDLVSTSTLARVVVPLTVCAASIRIPSRSKGIDVFAASIIDPGLLALMHQQLHDLARSIEGMDQYRKSIDYSVEEYIPHMTIEHLPPSAPYIGTWGNNCEQSLETDRVYVDWGDVAAISIDKGSVYDEIPW